MDVCRLCGKESVSDSWRQSVSWVIERTQTVVHDVYGATLKLDSVDACR